MATFQLVSFLFLVSCICLYLWHIIYERQRMRGAKPPPGPKGLPIFGNALDLARDPHLIPTFNKWTKEYGPIVGINIMGQKQVIIASEKAANDLFSKRGNIYSDRGTPPAMKVMTEPLSATALIDRTETWRRQRKLLHSVISIAENAKYEQPMELESQYTLLDLLTSPADFDDHLARYAYGVVSRVGLGYYTKSMQDPLISRLQQQGEFAVNLFRPDKYPSNLAPWLLKLPSWLCKDFAIVDTARRRLQKYILDGQDELRNRMKNGEAPESIHRYFLEHQSEFGLNDLEGGTVFNIIMTAGTRSPHNALLGFVIMMMQNPEWLLKLQQEIDRVVGDDRMPTFADLPHLPTVRAVVKEGVRYRSVVAEIGIPHKLSQDDVYEGYFFPAGTVFHAHINPIVTEPTMYPDGHTFNPARWLDPAYPTYREPLTVYPNLQNYASFGYGRRACPASNFSERSLTIMVARIAWACNIKKPIDPETKKEVELNIVYEPVANPRPLRFPAAFEPRNAKRSELVAREVKAAREKDPLLVGS